MRPSATCQPFSSAQQLGPGFAVPGLIGIAGAFGLRAIERRRQHRVIESFRLEQARKDVTSRALERAAWLLASEFSSLDGCSEAEFMRNRVFVAPRSGGEYRWDDARQRLLVTRTSFGELSLVRHRILRCCVRERARSSGAVYWRADRRSTASSPLHHLGCRRSTRCIRTPGLCVARWMVEREEGTFSVKYFVGRTPWSAADPLVGLVGVSTNPWKRDQGVPRRPGGPPH